MVRRQTMKALISPNEQSRYISSWNGGTPVFTVVGERVAEVAEVAFPVAEPLFWVDCPNNLDADKYGYLNGDFILIPPNVLPTQPLTQGTQTA
jgi:hypothetical protein